MWVAELAYLSAVGSDIAMAASWVARTAGTKDSRKVGCWGRPLVGKKDEMTDVMRVEQKAEVTDGLMAVQMVDSRVVR